MTDPFPSSAIAYIRPVQCFPHVVVIIIIIILQKERFQKGNFTVNFPQTQINTGAKRISSLMDISVALLEKVQITYIVP